MIVRKFPRSGTPNKTAPDIKAILEKSLSFKPNNLYWQEVQAWLADELFIYRITSVNEGTPKEQKAELEKYIKALEGILPYLNSTQMLPADVAALIMLNEDKHGFTPHTDETVSGYLLKKIIIAKQVQKEMGAKGSSGAKAQRKAYTLLYQLAKKIADGTNLKEGETLHIAALILNEPEALGAEHKCYNNADKQPPRTVKVKLSTEPAQIKKQLKTHKIGANQKKLS